MRALTRRTVEVVIALLLLGLTIPAGADAAPRRTYAIELQLTIPSAATARRIEAALRRDGYRVRTEAETMGSSHFLLIRRELSLSEDALAELRADLCRQATAAGGHCDDWRAADILR